MPVTGLQLKRVPVIFTIPYRPSLHIHYLQGRSPWETVKAIYGEAFTYGVGPYVQELLQFLFSGADTYLNIDRIGSFATMAVGYGYPVGAGIFGVDDRVVASRIPVISVKNACIQQYTVSFT